MNSLTPTNDYVISEVQLKKLLLKSCPTAWEKDFDVARLDINTITYEELIDWLENLKSHADREFENTQSKKRRDRDDSAEGNNFNRNKRGKPQYNNRGNGGRGYDRNFKGKSQYKNPGNSKKMHSDQGSGMTMCRQHGTHPWKYCPSNWNSPNYDPNYTPSVKAKEGNQGRGKINNSGGGGTTKERAEQHYVEQGQQNNATQEQQINKSSISRNGNRSDGTSLFLPESRRTLSNDNVCRMVEKESRMEHHSAAKSPVTATVITTITDIFYTESLCMGGYELPPLPTNVPKPDMEDVSVPIDSHHFDSLLFPPQEDGKRLGSSTFDIFSIILGDPFTLVKVNDEVYVPQETDNIKTEKMISESEEVKRPATMMNIGSIQGQVNKTMTTFMVLLDSGSDRSMIHQKCIPRDTTMKSLPVPALGSTLAGSFETRFSVQLTQLVLPEFGKNKQVSTLEALVFDSPC